MIKKLLKILALLLLLCLVIFFLYFNNINGVDPIVKNYYLTLKDSLQQKGYSPKTVVISTKRTKWHNNLLTQDGAAKDSKHLTGDAIDFIVLDINDDG